MKPHVKITKYALIILAVLVLLLSSGVVLVYYLFPKDKALVLLVSGAEKALNRKVTVKGLDYSPKGIILSGVAIYDSPGGCGEVFASADEAVIRFSVIKLIFRRQFDIYFIGLNNLALNICYRDGVSNLEALLKELDRGEEPSAISTSIDTVMLENARVSLKNPPPVLRPLEGEYLIDGTLDLSQKTKISLSDSRIVLPEKRGAARPEITLTVKDGDFEISGDVTLEKCSLLWVYRWGRNLALPYSDVSAKVKDLKITARAVEGAIKGTSTLSNGRQLFISGYCRVNITGETVLISATQGSIQQSSFTVDEFMFDFGGSIKRFRIRSINAQIEEIAPVLMFAPPELYGSVRGGLSYENARYNGSLTLAAGYNRKENLLKNLAGTVTIRDNVVEKTPLSLVFMNQPCDVTVASRDGGFKKIELNIRLNEFAYDTGKKSASPAGFRPVSLPVEIAGRIDVASLRIGDFIFNGIGAAYSFSGGRLSLPDITGQMLGADIKGRGSIDLMKPKPKVDLSFTFGNLKIQNLGKISERLKDRFFGVASGNTELGFVIDDNFNILNSLRGRLEFSIDKGKLVNTGIQDGLGVWLEELKYKLKDLEFNRIYGNFTLLGPSYRINSFVFNAPDVRLRVDGQLTRELEGDVRIDLEFTRTFIQDLPNPVFLQLSKYKKDRWYVIPFRSRGKDITDSKNLKRLD